MEVAQLKHAVEEQGMSYDTYKNQMKEQIALQKLQQEEVAKTINITQDDVKKFIRENKGKLNPYNAFHVVDVMMPIAENATSTQIDSLKKQASELVKQLQKGKNVDEVLKQYPYAQNNDLGWRSLGELPSIFQATVATMGVKSVNAPIQAPNGLHILKLLEAKGENAKLSETDLKNLAFQQKVNEGLKDWIQTLRKEAYIKIMK